MSGGCDKIGYRNHLKDSTHLIISDATRRSAAAMRRGDLQQIHNRIIQGRGPARELF